MAAVIGLPLAAAGGGVALIGFYIASSNPWLVLALGLVLCAQGSYGLVYALGLAGRRHPFARRALLTASALAVLVGLGGFGTGLAANTNPANNDPEFRPMMVALLVAAHGTLSLLAFSRRARAPARER
ncbi:MAG: hypothetical protein OXG37_05040 [Actinomycetia bacterium]|nr:hypothetical protein [Actinomycetes bacterium]